MAGTPLPAPSNPLISVLNVILDVLIKGLGVGVAVTAAVARWPWLGLPFINDVFRWVVGQLAQVIDDNLKTNADIIVIRFQNDARKAEYDQAIDELKKSPQDAAAIQAAKDAIDRIVRRSK